MRVRSILSLLAAILLSLTALSAVSGCEIKCDTNDDVVEDTAEEIDETVDDVQEEINEEN